MKYKPDIQHFNFQNVKRALSPIKLVLKPKSSSLQARAKDLALKQSKNMFCFIQTF